MCLWECLRYGLVWAVKAQATGLVYNDFAYSSACTAPAHWQYNFLLLRCSRRRRKLAQLSLAGTAPLAAAASPVCRGTAATTVCLRQLSACLPTFFYVPTYYQIACYTSRVSEFLVTVWPEPIWIKVNGWWQILPQHQSLYLRGPESASIKLPPWWVSFPLVLVGVLAHFHFNLVSLVLALFQIG